MKLYIPILSSNIDNVLSSESISPSTFYKKRSFGYKSFDSIQGVDSESILLYKELEKCPAGNGIIYIEWDDSLQQKSLEEISDGTYCIHYTIRIYPWNAIFLFKDSKDLEKTVTFCTGSLNNKLWDYYEFKLIKFESNKENETFSNNKKSYSSNYNYIEEDNRNNRLKGFLFGYNIGKQINLSPKMALLRKYSKQISDLCSVISGIPYDKQRSYIEEIDKLKGLYNELNPKRNELKIKWNEEVLASYSTDKDRSFFTDIAKHYNVLRQMMDGFAKEKGIYTGPSVVDAKRDGNWELFRTQLSDYTNQILQEDRDLHKNENDCQVIIEGGKICLSKTKSFYNKIINSLINGIELPSINKTGNSRLDKATQLTILIKELIENDNGDWMLSKECQFYNELRKSISSSNGVDLSTLAPDDMAEAWAIYILRGEDFEDMIRFSVASGFGRYDLLLAIWGVNKGYVDIPKTIFSYLNIVNEVLEKSYIFTYELMFPHDKNVHTLIKRSHNIKDLSNSNEHREKEHCSTPESYTSYLASIIKKKELKFTAEQQKEILDIYEKLNNKINPDFFKAVLKIRNVGKTKVNRLKDALHYKDKKDEVNSRSEVNDTKYDDRPIKEKDWIYIVPYCGYDNNKIASIHKDFLWFINEGWKKYGKTVASYVRYLHSRKSIKSRKLAWITANYSDVDIESIERSLKDE